MGPLRLKYAREMKQSMHLNASPLADETIACRIMPHTSNSTEKTGQAWALVPISPSHHASSPRLAMHGTHQKYHSETTVSCVLFQASADENEGLGVQASGS